MVFHPFTSDLWQLALAAWLGLAHAPAVWAFFFCCCQSCDLWADDFAADKLATKYDVAAGSWSVSGGVLTTSSDNALLLAKKVNPEGAQSYLKVRFNAGTSGDLVRGCIAVADSANYLFAEVEVDTTCGALRLYRVAGGVTTELGTELPAKGAVPSAWHTLYVCYDAAQDRFLATFAAASGATQTRGETVSASGGRSGVGTGAITGSVSFDDYDFDQSFPGEEEECSTCKPPSCTYHSVFPPGEFGCPIQIVSGTWAEVVDPSSGASYLECTASGRILIQVLHPGALPRGRIRFGARIGPRTSHRISNTNRLRVIVDYLDADNYHYVDSYFTDPEIGEPPAHGSIRRVAGGVDTLVMQHELRWFDAAYILNGVNSVCYSPNKVGVGLASGLFADPPLGPSIVVPETQLHGGLWMGFDVVLQPGNWLRLGVRLDRMAAIGDSTPECNFCTHCSICDRIPATLAITAPAITNANCNRCTSVAPGGYLLALEPSTLGVGYECVWTGAAFALGGNCLGYSHYRYQAATFAFGSGYFLRVNLQFSWSPAGPWENWISWTGPIPAGPLAPSYVQDCRLWDGIVLAHQSSNANCSAVGTSILASAV